MSRFKAFALFVVHKKLEREILNRKRYEKQGDPVEIYCCHCDVRVKRVGAAYFEPLKAAFIVDRMMIDHGCSAEFDIELTIIFLSIFKHL